MSDVNNLKIENAVSENCSTCINDQETVCQVFNEPVIMFKLSTMKHGCNSYTKDVNKMLKLPEEHQFDSKKYILWDTQYSEQNAQFSRALMEERMPKSEPKILRVHNDKTNEELFGVYVKVLKNAS